MVAGIKADAGDSTWATRCQLFSGLGLFVSTGAVFLTVLTEDYVGDAASIFWGLAVSVSAIVFIVGTIGFCSRFGATSRRVTQLEEIESALSAAVAHSEREDEKREGERT